MVNLKSVCHMQITTVASVKCFVDDEDRGICCDVYNIWHHVQSNHFSLQICDFMVSGGAGMQLNWTCSFCERGHGK